MVRLSKEAEKKAMELIYRPAAKKSIGFRLRAKMNGCKINYEMMLADNKRNGEAVVEQGKIKLFMDIDSFHMLTGAVVEYMEQNEQGGFMIIQKSSPCSACNVSSLGNCS